MPLDLTIEIFGEKIVQRRMLRVGERAVDAAPAFLKISEMFYASEKKQFDTEGSWASHGWAPDKQSTINEKVRNGYSTLTLQRTGQLMKSLTTPDADSSVRKIGPDFVEVRSTVPYGKYHQKGTQYMPMRKPAELADVTKVEMVKVIQAWVMGEIDVAGGEAIV